MIRRPGQEVIQGQGMLEGRNLELVSNGDNKKQWLRDGCNLNSNTDSSLRRAAR